MEFDFTRIGAELRYKLLCSFVGPRPIALVTTLSLDGVPNAAPMSFFNVFAQTPPLLILGLQDRVAGPKDTTRNARDTGEFVVKLVDAPMAQAMVACSVDHPPEVDEAIEAGLTLVPSTAIGPGRLRVPPRAHRRLSRPLHCLRRGPPYARPRHLHRA
jgi:flavin reductase (DIM6/NTAB) family NADH-FMN oxidoreductase RutF